MKTSNPKSELPLKSLDMSSSFEEGQVVEWLTQYGRKILFVSFALIPAFLLLFRFGIGNDVKLEQDYIQAENDYQSIVQSMEENGTSPAQAEALTQLEGIIQKNPELQTKYAGALAQILLIQNHPEQAQAFENPALDRLEKESLLDQKEFAAITLLIQQEQLAEALKRSQALRINMQQAAETAENAFSSGTLFAYNLLRTGILQQQLGLGKDELSTWQEWQQLSEGEKKIVNIDRQFFVVIQRQFLEGHFSLLDYIAIRKNVLNNK